MRFRSWRLAALTSLAALVGAFLVSPSGTAEAAARPVVAVIGDSYTAGYGVTSTSQAWWRYTVRDLGWTVGTVVADPSGGYVRSGKLGTYAQALKSHPINQATNYVLLQGGYNDHSQSPSAVMAGVRDVLSIIHAQAPKAVVVVVGAFLPDPSKVTPNFVQVARAIGNTQAIGSTRYLTGFLCSFSLAPDRVHPDAAGHRTVGEYVAKRITHGLDKNGKPFHKDPTGTFYTA